MDIEQVWESFEALDKQLKSARGDVPVTRTEYADTRMELAKLGYRVDQLQKVVKEQFAAGIKTGLIAAAAFAGITVLAHRLLPK